jgi:hypothetical protein
MASESLFSGLEVLDNAKGPVSMVSVPSSNNWRAVQGPQGSEFTTEVFLRFDGR